MSESVSERLRTLADELDSKTFKPVNLTDTLTINQAGKLLREAFPDRSFSIQIEVTFSAFGKPKAEWQIWDGSNFRRGKTLQDAYNITLRSLSDAPANAAELAEESIGATVPGIAEPADIAGEIEADPFAASPPPIEDPDAAVKRVLAR